ncbi:unnamed protein product [Gemmataceae bacterium]|nr:unnamed protein product [Gemmataceae bacterium]VTT97314.1 unnamed protein product [Gemmataceae bacterium]
MPVVTCPKCPTKLRVADTATGNVKCPKCGTMFPVAQTPPKPQPKPAFEVVDDAPPPPKAPAAPKSAAGPRATPPAPAPAAPGAAGNPFSFDDADSKPRKKKSVFDDAGDDEPAPARDEDEPPPRKKARADEDEPPRARKASDGGKGSKWGGTDDEDDDDRPRKKRRRDDDDEDDEDDRPRSKKRRYADDEDDEDDRPRSKKRRRSDDDDDDRPRGKKRRYADEDDDEDDEDWHSSPKKKKKGAAGFGNAKIGVLLLNISFWLYGASLALISLYIFLGWTGAFDGSSSSGSTTVRRTNNRGGFTEETSSSTSAAELALKLPGLLGMGNWIVAGVGFGFCIAGPQRSRGMAIAAASLAAGHLVLAGISINNIGGRANLFGGGASAITWLLWASTLLILDLVVPAIIQGHLSSVSMNEVFAVLAAGCELARLICAMLMVKAIAAAAKDYDAEEKAQFGVMGAAGVVGASAILALLVALLAKAEAIKSLSTLMNVAFGTVLLIYLGFTAMTIMPIWATHGLRGELARKSR